MDWKYLFTSYEGRINRAKFWAGHRRLLCRRHRRGGHRQRHRDDLPGHALRIGLCDLFDRHDLLRVFALYRQALARPRQVGLVEPCIASCRRSAISASSPTRLSRRATSNRTTTVFPTSPPRTFSRPHGLLWLRWLLFSFQGRIGRRDFWIGVGLIAVVDALQLWSGFALLDHRRKRWRPQALPWSCNGDLVTNLMRVTSSWSGSVSLAGSGGSCEALARPREVRASGPSWRCSRSWAASSSSWIAGCCRETPVKTVSWGITVSARAPITSQGLHRFCRRRV